MKKILIPLAILTGISFTAVVNAQDDLWSTPEEEIHTDALNGLTMISEPWELSTFFCNTDEIFLMARKVSNSHIVAISVDESQDPWAFFFYDLDKEGNEISKAAIPGADYSIDNRNNLTEIKGIVYYFSDTHSKTVFSYNLKKKTFVAEKSSKMDWEKIDDWRSHRLYDTEDGNLTMELEDTYLSLIDNEAQQNNVLIMQEYEGDWSFGQGAWNDASDKFYVDNSGAVACIWEVDLSKRTLNKIVPDHEASHPVFLEEGRILYCQESCIMQAIAIP
ncbi:MAG: hypothetical protein JW801_06245 [Bacteroidales bacterium]|nr:hypothetical protein [Bacteroidales bacterium]